MSLRSDLFDSVVAGPVTTRVLLVADRGRTDLRELLAGTLQTIQCVIQYHADVQLQKPPARPDLILVDLSLPDERGLKICRELYYLGVRAPILMWNRARTDVVEFLSSVRLLLTRSLDGNSGALTEFDFGAIHVEFTRGAVTRAGMPVRLSTKEFQLLRYLIAWRGSVLSRAELLDAVWQYRATTTRTLDVHVSLLRQKLEDAPHRPRHILTLRGRGYFFQE
uniref:Two component transcriptional regulator, winged helix family n=1 Tax=Solibacter usitatus (strain Ellin6076) TaxID=234267 RepID=Q01ZD3_SOLUE